jgi:hypothetical protein
MDSSEYLPVEVTVGMMTGQVDLDPMLIKCPACRQPQLRSEIRSEWRHIGEAAAIFGVPERAIRDAGAKLDAFGRVQCAVPWVTCMACGADFDGSREPLL